MARTRFGPEGERYYDPRWSRDAAERAARGLFLQRLKEIAPEVGEDVPLGAFRAAGAPRVTSYHELWARGPGFAVTASASGWARELGERAARVKARRREMARDFGGLRRALLAWRRRWNLREKKPLRDPWLLDAVLYTLQHIQAGAGLPAGLIIQPLGAVAGRINRPLPSAPAWDVQRGETLTAYRERVATYEREMIAVVGLVEVEGANKAARDFDMLIRRRVHRVRVWDLAREYGACETRGKRKKGEEQRALEKRTIEIAINRAARRVSLR